MKKVFFIFYLFIITVTNSFPQEYDNHPSIKVDTGYINVDGGKLFYEIAGEGEYIVLLHDGLVHREIWDEQFLVLAKKYKVIRYDRHGYGKSTYPQSHFSHIDDLNQLFDQLSIDRAIISGISGGGELAIDFTLKYPEKVFALVLVGAIVSGFEFSSHTLNRFTQIFSLRNDPQKFIQYIAWEDPYEIYFENRKTKEKLVQLLNTNPNNVNLERTFLVKPSDRPAVNFLSEIHIPVLVLVGEFDLPDCHANAGVIEFGIPNAKREIINKSGHLIPLEQPEVFNASVLRFLNGIEFFNILNSEGVDAAVKQFQNRRKSEPDIILFEEGKMNLLGYQYLQNGKISEAIELFKLNTISYPNSWNVFDNLGEAYMIDGKKSLAIKNYKKSLELNPDNNNAIEMLKKLENY